MRFTFLSCHAEYFVGAVPRHAEQDAAAVIFSLHITPIGTEKKFSAELDQALDIFIALSHTTPTL